MILLGRESKLSAAQVLEKAVKYFGPDGLGLEVQHWNAVGVQMVGSGGYVAVRAQPQPELHKSSVEIESREWEYDAERFLGEI